MSGRPSTTGARRAAVIVVLLAQRLGRASRRVRAGRSRCQVWSSRASNWTNSSAPRARSHDRPTDGVSTVARVAVWEPMPTVDRDWVLDSTTEVAGDRATCHLRDPQTGNGLSMTVVDNAVALGAAMAALATAIGWNEKPHRRFTPPRCARRQPLKGWPATSDPFREHGAWLRDALLRGNVRPSRPRSTAWFGLDGAGPGRRSVRATAVRAVDGRGVRPAR